MIMNKRKPEIEQWLVKFLTVPTNKMVEELLRPLFNQYLRKTHEFLTNTKFEKNPQKHWVWIRTKENWTEHETLVAHIDTVSDYDTAPSANDLLILTPGNTLVLDEKADAKIKCLGADDRAGVAMIWQLVKSIVSKQEKVDFNLFFPSGEEVGTQGTREFLRIYKETFKTPYMLEFDRRGNDIVGYDNGNISFMDDLEQAFDKATATGTFSDIAVFQRELKILSANISVGYKHEHTRSEELNLDTWYATFEKLKELIADYDARDVLKAYVWKDKPTRTYPYGQKSYGYGDDDWGLDLPKKEFTKEEKEEAEDEAWNKGWDLAMETVEKNPDKYFEKSRVLVFMVNAIARKINEQTSTEIKKLKEEIIEIAQTTILETRKKKWWHKNKSNKKN